MPNCCWQASRKCSDGTLSGLFLDLASIPASRTMVQGGVCYYFANPGTADQKLFCGAGTAHTSYSSVASCSDPACSPTTTPCGTCTGLGGGLTPSKIRVDLSGLTLCGAACYLTTTGFQSAKVTGTFGTYDCLQDTAGTFGTAYCTWVLDCATGPLVQIWGNGTCAGGEVFKSNKFRIVVELLAGPIYRVTVSTAFSAGSYTTACPPTIGASTTGLSVITASTGTVTDCMTAISATRTGAPGSTCFSQSQGIADLTVNQTIPLTPL